MPTTIAAMCRGGNPLLPLGGEAGGGESTAWHRDIMNTTKRSKSIEAQPIALPADRGRKRWRRDGGGAQFEARCTLTPIGSHGVCGETEVTEKLCSPAPPQALARTHTHTHERII